jgi:hypothetical protein
VSFSEFSGTFGVVLGWLLAIITRHFDDVWFGAKLGIECKGVPGNKDETSDGIFIEFRVQNSTKRRVSKELPGLFGRATQNQQQQGNL